MKFYGRYILFIFIVIFSFNIEVGVAQGGDVCCYNPDADSLAIGPKWNSGCDDGDVELSIPIEDCLDTSRQEVLDEEHRLGCYDSFGGCDSRVFNKIIYDFPEVKGYFSNDLGLELDDLCYELKPYDANECEGNLNVAGGSSGSNDNGGSSDSSTGIPDSAVDYEDEVDLHEESEAQTLCSDVGGPFGLFVSKNSCNDLTNDLGLKPCLYNPYKSGNIGLFSADNVIGLDSSEVSCVHKSTIENCYDYKSEENCIGNVIANDPANSRYMKKNLKSCKWVDTTEFFGAGSLVGGYFDTDSGICLSDASSSGEHYNMDAYYDRGNLLKNPSFEDSSNGWQGNLEIIESDYSFDGKSYAKIYAGDEIYQNIYDIGDKYYNFFLYLRGDNFSVGDRVEVRITEYDLDGNSINSESFFSDNLDEFDMQDIFSQVRFLHDGHKISNGTGYIEFKVIADSEKDILVDAINFEFYKTGEINDPKLGNKLFKQLEVVPQEASSCELCFDENNLNFCTELKSDLLGDCSYMVSSLNESYESELGDNYLGREENFFMNDSKWRSQSIPNSKVFCGLYLEEETCTDEGNYVNSVVAPLHYQSGTNLCVWDDEYGCYKDSDASDGPDTMNSGELFLHVSYPDDLNIGGLERFTLENYSVESSSTKASDFAYSCDIIPPQGYVYFHGYDVNGESIYIGEDFPSETVGGVSIGVEAYDVDVESCEGYDFDKAIYVESIVDGRAGIIYNDKATFNVNMPIKDFFKDGAEEDLFVEDGVHDLSIVFKDQSGNLGKVLDYSLDVDLNGPNVTLLNPVASENGLIGPLGPNSSFDFSITDYSNITSCSYDLALKSWSSGDESYYDSGGELNLSEMHVSGDVYRFDLPIYNTTSNTNYYDLSLECEDIFGQKSEPVRYSLGVDFDTSFILLEPQGFTSYDENIGFINSSRDIWAISTDENLGDCRLDPRETDGSSSGFNIAGVSEGFFVEDYSSSIKVYSNITGDISFSNDGVKEISIICDDSMGNEVVENITYYYDTSKPEFVEYSLIGVEDAQKSVVYVDGNYYTRIVDKSSPSSLLLGNYLNVTLDGVFSWISTKEEDYSLEFFNGSDYKDVTRDVDYGFSIDEDNSVGTLFVGNFEDLNIYGGLEGEDEDLYLQKYLLNFKDKAGNTNFEEIEYFYDDSDPEFVFGGDIYHDGGKELYTRTNNPLINLTFDAPDYRGFNCDLSFSYDGLKHNTKNDPSFDFFANSLEFKISEIVSGFNLDTQSSFEFDVECEDIYGFRMGNSFTLKYDNTSPVLEGVRLDDGNNLYLGNGGSSTLIETIEDKLVFDLADTGEDEYSCVYQFRELDSFSNCDSSFRTEVFDADGSYKTNSELEVLSENLGGICYRNRSYINAYLDDYYDNDQSLRTKIEVSGKCFDKVNLSTRTMKEEINVVYVAGNKFVDFDIDYNLDMATFTVTSLSEFADVRVSFDELGEDVIATMTRAEDRGDGLFRYTGSIDTSDFGSDFDSIQVWAVGFSSGGAIMDKISNRFVIDMLAPEVEIDVLDATKDGDVYFEDFQILFNAKDEGGSKLSSVKLYLDDTLIFDGNDVEGYDSSYLDEPDISKNKFSHDMSDFYGSLVFNGEIGSNYEFKVVATDGYGNTDEAVLPIYVKDGIGIRLLDSENSVVDFDRFSWITKKSEPKVKFETSKQVDQCSIYPFVDERWVKVTGDSEVEYMGKTILGRSDNTYEFDLSGNDFEDFDLNSLDDAQSMIGIKCRYNGTDYNFSRKVSLIDKLPDYVLSSSGGFVMNSYPYETVLEVKSVGPYKYLTCSYQIEGDDRVEFGQGLSARFEEDLNFDTYIEGSYELVLECEDKLGTRGPRKSYDFVINKNLETKISDLKLLRGKKEYYPQDDMIYVDREDGLGIEFRANKEDVSCNYEISGGSGIYRLINFVKSMFADNREEIDSTGNGFLYRVDDGLDFSSGKILDVSCSGFEEPMRYNIVYMDSSSLDFGLN